MGSVEVGLLGPLEVRVGGRQLEVPRGRVQTLLAGLAVSPGRPVSLDSLVEYVWGAKAAPLTARQVLQNTVWRLRRVIGADVVAAAGEAYRLDVNPDAVDVARFTRLLDRATAAGDGERDLLVRALGLWRGEPLTGIDSETLRRDVAPALTERYLAAVERRIDLDLAAGVRDGSVAELRALIAEHPVRESLWVRLLRALAASGRDADALQAYEQIRRRLADQLGADPCEELRDIHHRLLTGVPLDNAQRVSPAPARAVPAPRQLPADVVGFVGRAEELAALDRLLDNRVGDGRQLVRIVVLHGVGGVGKTALAVRWAHIVADGFPDGQFYLDLRGYGPGEPVAAHEALGGLLRSAGVDGGAIPQQPDERAALWRSAIAGRRVLLLLDNARDAEQVRPLLPGADSVVVVTSRSQLRGLTRRDGAASLALGELDDSDAHRLLRDAIGAEKVRREAVAAADLVDLCGGLPLALRVTADLASGRADVPLADLADGLRAHRLETLADPDDPSADPRTVLSWSYRAVPAEQARVFRRLSLHPGADISLAAAAGLLGVPAGEARRCLDRLVAVHLLEQPRADRYRFHDLVREYAAERAAAEDSSKDRAAGTRRILDWYLHTANQVQRMLRAGDPLTILAPGDPDLEPLRFADRSAALTWFHMELSTVVEVVRHAADHGFPTHAYQVGWVLANALELTQRLDEWLAVAEVGHRSALTLDTTAKYRTAHELGVALSYLGRLDESEAYKIEAMRHAETLGVPRSTVAALNGLGVLRQRRGDWLGAIELWLRALGIARDNDLHLQAAHCLLNIGGEEANYGRYAEAIRHSQQALAAYRELDATLHQGMALSNLADAYARSGDLAQALSCCDEAARVFAQTDGGAAPMAFAMEMTSIYADAGHRDKARSVLRRTLDMLRGGDHPQLSEARRLLAELGDEEDLGVGPT